MTEQTTTETTADQNNRTWQVTWPDGTRDIFTGSHTYTDSNSGCLYIARRGEGLRVETVAIVNPAHAALIHETTVRDEDWTGQL